MHRLFVLLPCCLATALAILPGIARAAGPADEPPDWLELLEHETQLAGDPGWRVDPELQLRLEGALEAVAASSLAAEHRLGVALVDLSDIEEPRLAEVNGLDTVYAASLPKVAVLYAALVAEQEGRLEIDAGLEKTLSDMIRVSSNSAASEAIAELGFDYIASVLWQSGVYDPKLGGGLWVGKAYGGPNDRWHRDPVAGTSHGASPRSVARLFTLLGQGRLLKPEGCRRMKAFLGEPGLNHKFVKGLEAVQPTARVFRKSGTWRDWHGDAALIERSDGARYVAVALCQSAQGGALLEKLIVELDACIPSPPAGSESP